MHNAVFFLSTGRCGTQWLAKYLKDYYSEQVEVEHEPIGNDYRYREMLGVDWDADPKVPLEVVRHVTEIKNRLREKDYIECGHTSWSLIPCLAKRFEGQIRVVHLTRHPVKTACSWVTHTAYRQPILPDLHKAKILLTPFDKGVLFSEYREIWKRMNPFEKCLYFWLEVNAYGLKIGPALGIPWLHLKSEGLFNGNGLPRLLDFLHLPVEKSLLEKRSEKYDRFLFATEIWWDFRNIKNHPRILDMSDKLGYDPFDFDEHSLQKRYWLGAQTPVDM